MRKWGMTWPSSRTGRARPARSIAGCAEARSPSFHLARGRRLGVEAAVVVLTSAIYLHLATFGSDVLAADLSPLDALGTETEIAV